MCTSPTGVRSHHNARVLTLERIIGIKVDDLDGIESRPSGRQDLATKAAGCRSSMVFEHGFFHADPHTGQPFIERAVASG